MALLKCAHRRLYCTLSLEHKISEYHIRHAAVLLPVQQGGECVVRACWGVECMTFIVFNEHPLLVHSVMS